ncbi:MAG: cytochrome c-type biogenesis protein CcmH [Candidatus Neomarinimicrobiota bacterium]
MKIIIPFIMLAFLQASDNKVLIKDIEQSLMAPCCWSGTVYDHGHSELEAEIAAFVKAGKTKAEIIDYYEQKYGERILAVPVAKGFNLLAWLAPVFIGVIALGVIFMYVKTNAGKKEEIQLEKDVLHSEQIERELKELDN